MTKRFVGVALAAVMACGWAGGARAAPFTITGSAGDGDHFFGLNASFGNTRGSYSLTYHLGDGGCRYNTVCYSDDIVTDSNAIITLGPITTDNTQNYRDINIFSQSAKDHTHTVYNDDTPDFDQTVQRPFDIHIQLAQLVSIPGGFIDGVVFTDFGFPQQFDTPFGNIIISQNIFSPVPLPSSAPLFGLALLGLGGFGYGLKRRSRVAAG